MLYILSLLAAAALACIPANIAKDKGYSFGIWWVYGWLLFAFAIIHVLCLPDRNVDNTKVTKLYNEPSKISYVEELRKLRSQHENGDISKEEMEEKTEDLLSKM